MTESVDKQPNIVRTTVRMDAALHQALSDLIYDQGRGLPPKAKPSLDSAIQEAVRRYVEPPVTDSKPVIVDTKQTPKAAAEPTLGIPRADWHGMLDRVLDSKANYLVIAIVTNLLAFGRDAESIGGAKSPARYERYEARVLKALAELMGPEETTVDPHLAEYAEFLAEARSSEREAVEEMIKAWKHDKSKSAKTASKEKPKDAPKKKPDEGEGHGRKAV